MISPDALLASLPPLGAHARASFVVAQSGLTMAQAWGSLAILCCDGKATVEDGMVTRGRAPGWPKRNRQRGQERG